MIPDPCTQHVQVSLSKILNLKWLLELHCNERLGGRALVMSGTYEDGPAFLTRLPVDAPSHNTETADQCGHLLIVHDGGAISSHGLLFDHTDELEGAAERRIRIGPFRTLEMSHLQDIVVL